MNARSRTGAWLVYLASAVLVGFTFAVGAGVVSAIVGAILYLVTRWPSIWTAAIVVVAIAGLVGVVAELRGQRRLLEFQLSLVGLPLHEAARRAHEFQQAESFREEATRASSIVKSKLQWKVPVGAWAKARVWTRHLPVVGGAVAYVDEHMLAVTSGGLLLVRKCEECRGVEWVKVRDVQRLSDLAAGEDEHARVHVRALPLALPPVEQVESKATESVEQLEHMSVVATPAQQARGSLAQRRVQVDDVRVKDDSSE